MVTLALISLVLALLPAVLAAVNIRSLAAPEPIPAATGLVSILIPARNEAAIIAGTVQAALASEGVAVEVLVGDDQSTDATAAIVTGMAESEPRLRLVSVPALPEGWTGKNNGCVALAAAARGERLLFIDADVTLGPHAAAALSAHAERSGAALVSGVPRQVMRSLGEMLTVPAINFLLLGFLPIPLMRQRPDVSLAAACGQLVMVSADAYRETGGHGAVRASLHDGVMLPRMLRASGFRTDLVAGATLADCRMYSSFGQAWAGFSKNAREGMATPRALPVWTILLFGGHVLPWPLLAAALAAGRPAAALTAFAAGVVSLGTRAAITRACAEPLATIPLHPFAITTALAIQWAALVREARGQAPAAWKGRSYPVGPH
ncbi:glycosyltransferase [Methylobacterium sp. C25]|uniref:glycosyltransferase n=1 Tax=Methylobacterium sp. C25 TaxID=2721622 RepID=UPI001F3166F2|nr:glycosyltransferase [Methylobacterium sp. C25]MCE4224762.1 glycosyltransferase [Methylobacterium sp. C25]